MFNMLRRGQRQLTLSGLLGRAAARPYVLMFLVSLAFAASKSNTAIVAYNEAVGFANSGQWNSAVEAATRALSADPDFAEAYYLRGAARYSLQASESALMDLSDALRRDASMTSARALRGLIHYEADRYDQALEDVNRVLAQKPSETQSLLVRGIIRLKREELSPAAQDLRAFIRLKPEDPIVPKLREVLVTLKSDAPGDFEQTGDAEEKSASLATAAAPKRTAKAQTATTSGPAEAASVHTRALSEAFGRRLLQGNAAPVVGNIENRKRVTTGEH